MYLFMSANLSLESQKKKKIKKFIREQVMLKIKKHILR